MLKAIAQRILHAAVLLAAVVILNFVLISLAPGDIADTIAFIGGGADASVLEQIRRDYGLDRPFIVQLGSYVGRVAQFDLGHSFYYNRSVTGLILERLPATLLLVFIAQILALVAGVVLGVTAARRPNGVTSHFVSLFSLFSYSAPVFWTGILLLIALSLNLKLFPFAGMTAPHMADAVWWARALDVAHHLVLPALTLASVFLALYARLARASMLETLASDFVRTARAKGLSPGQVVYKHALRNALSPVVTLAGLQFSAVISGSVLVETVFNWPGLGTLAFESIIARDTPTILGILFFSALVVIIGNLLTDATLGAIDPRMRRRRP